MAKEPNKAERLFEVLSLARSLNGGSVNQRFGETLGINKDDSGELMRGLAAMHTLLTEIGEDLERIEARGEAHHKIFLEVQPTLRRALTPDTWFGAWDAQKQHIKETDLMALRGFGAALSKTRMADAIPDDQLARIGDMVNELERSVVECSMDAELKSFLVIEIAVIRRALLDYRIHGVVILRRALFEGIGTVVANQEKFKAEEAKTPAKDFIKVLSAINLAITSAEHLKALADPAIKLLAAHFGLQM